MDFTELEKIAKSREPMPEGLTLTEQKAFQSIALLTERYLIGRLPAQTAKNAMHQIRVTFAVDSGTEDYTKHCVELWLNIESAAREFAKERTIEAAEKMYEVIYNIKLERMNDG